MMATVFLIGGTGNQLFEFSRARESDKFSSFFLDQKVRKLLGWTQHETVFDFPKPNIIVRLLALTFLFMDLILAKVFKISLFAELDLRTVKLQPKIKRLIAMGYFQSGDIIRSPHTLSASLFQNNQIDKSPDVVIHIRGGDLADKAKISDSVYGYLSESYYSEALSLAQPKTDITIVTDDIPFATEIASLIDSKIKPNIISIPLGETIACCVKARVFISCNSTLSYWMVWLRDEQQRSYAQRPFLKRDEMHFANHVQRIDYTY